MDAWPPFSAWQGWPVLAVQVESADMNFLPPERMPEDIEICFKSLLHERALLAKAKNVSY